MGKVGDRVKEIRKASGEYKTLEKFGAKIGLSKTAISDIENGRRNLTEQSFKSICREFSVNPEWLRDGSGEMFEEKRRHEKVMEIAGRHLEMESDLFRQRLISVISELSIEQLAVLAEIAEKIVGQ